MAKGSAVDPRCTINAKGEKICGGFRPHGKTRFKEEGWTIEKLIKDPVAFREMICHHRPDTKGYGNGRCFLHGRGGRKEIHGKYSTYLSSSLSSEDIVKSIQDHKTGDLSPELAIIGRFIEEKLPKAMGEHASHANKEMRKKIEKLRKDFLAFNMEAMRDTFKDIDKLFDEAYDAEKAKKDITEMVKTYSEVFNVNLKAKQVSDQYIHREKHNATLLMVVRLASNYISNPHEREEFKKNIVRAIGFGDRTGLEPQSGNISSQLVPLEDQNERQETDYINAEYSTEDV